MKNVTMYCVLSKTTQLINLREIYNIAGVWQIFGAKTEPARIRRRKGFSVAMKDMYVCFLR